MLEITNLVKKYKNSADNEITAVNMILNIILTAADFFFSIYISFSKWRLIYLH